MDPTVSSIASQGAPLLISQFYNQITVSTAITPTLTFPISAGGPPADPATQQLINALQPTVTFSGPAGVVTVLLTELRRAQGHGGHLHLAESPSSDCWATRYSGTKRRRDRRCRSAGAAASSCRQDPSVQSGRNPETRWSSDAQQDSLVPPASS